MKPIFTTFLFIFLNAFVFAQNNWGRVTTSNFTNEAIDVEKDNSGNIYTVGYFSGGTSFENNVTQVNSQGLTDIYVSKYDGNGNFLWVKTFGSNFSDKPTDMALDSQGNIILTGQFFGQISFGSTTLTASGTSKDIFIAKLTNVGIPIWAINEGGAGSENAYGIAIDNLNDIVLTGQFDGATTIGGQNFTSMNDPTTSTTNYDMFISKYTSNGVFSWIKTGTAKYEERGLAIACDGQNNIFMTGQFSDTLVFANSTFNNTAYNVGFVAKFNPTGSLLYMNQLKAGMVVPYDIKVNGADEPVIIGDFLGTLNYYTNSGITSITAPHTNKIFVLKINNNGNVMWKQSFGSNNDLSARALAIDAFKNVFVTGFFDCSWTQFHLMNTALYNSVGYRDVHLIKIDDAGIFAYAKTFGSNKNDLGHGIAIDNDQKPIICGSNIAELYIPMDNNLNYSTNQTNPFVLNVASQSNYQGMIGLSGDLSANSFLTNAIQPTTPDYNYFYNLPNDSLIGHINPNVDTVDFCLNTYLSYQPYTSFNGPVYNYLWSNGNTSSTIYINQTNNYIVIVEREDGCGSGGDTIHAIHHSLPPFPNMTDNLGIAVATTNYPNYSFCAPDSVTIWFSNLCPGCSISIDPTNIQDVLPHVYSVEDYYTVEISDSFCQNQQGFFINMDYPAVYDSIIPYLFFPEDTDFNDTITICDEENLFIHTYDSITNPNGTLNLFFDEPTIGFNYTVSGPTNFAVYNNISLFPSGNPQHKGYFYPEVTGWHTFTYETYLGFENECGLDSTFYSVTDSIYIIVNPLPTQQGLISADDLLCPDGSLYLTVNPVIPGFTWGGPAIAYVSASTDSAQITLPGYYYYGGNLIDTVTGCSQYISFGYIVYEKQPPLITSNPVDGIVCPGDSVTLSVPNIYASYDWLGPDGSSLSNTNILIDADMGFYYCVLVDSGGCSLTTTPAEILEYATPALTVSPFNVICENENVDILVNYDGQVSLNWINPAWAGSLTQISVNQTGTYICEIQQCGITTIDSVTIVDGSFTVNLTATDSLLCYGDTSILSVGNGLGNYLWSNGFSGSSILSTTEAGQYSVLVTNQYGCEAYSDTIIIGTVPLSFPPAIDDSTICPGEDITLIAPNSIPVIWFDAQFNPINTGTSYTFSNLFFDTLVYAAYDVIGCPPAFQDVNIFVDQPFVNGVILGDTLICPNEITELSVNLAPDAIQWFVDSVLTFSGLLFDYSNPMQNDVQLITAIISNSCFSDTLYQNIHTYSSPVLALNFDSVTICGSNFETLEAITTLDSINWSSSLGSQTTDYLDVNNTFDNQSYVFAQGFDSNGCVSNMDSVFLQIPPDPALTIFASSQNCFGDSLLLASSSFYDSIYWNISGTTYTDDTVSLVLNSTSLDVTLYVMDYWGCEWEDTLSILPNNLPAPIMFDTVICFTDWYNFFNNNQNLTILLPNGNPVDTSALQANAWFQFAVTNPATGCFIEDSVFIETVSCSNLIPNAITPNNDGINEYFVIQKALLQPNNTLIIFNRWGNEVFQMKGYDNTWNGEDLTEGTYFYTYIVDVTVANSRIQNGFIHLKR